MPEPRDGRSLEAVLLRAQSFGWERLPLALAAYVVAEAVKQAQGRPGGARPLEAKDVLIGFEGGVTLLADGPVDGGPLLERLGGAPDAAQAALPHARLLRELLGKLFDAELLASGHLFFSDPSDRAQLQALWPSPRAAAGPAPEVTAARSRRAPPAPLLALAGVLTSVAVGVMVYEVAGPREAVKEPAMALPSGPPPRPAAKPVTAEAAEPPQPAPELQPSITFDAESAPVSFRLTAAHQVVVPRLNCSPAPKKWTIELVQKGRAVVSAPRGNWTREASGMSMKQMQQAASAAHPFGVDRKLPLLALFAPKSGAARLLELDDSTSGTGPGELCFFSLSDRSLEQETISPRVSLNREELTTSHALVNVEPDDRFVVRSLPGGKTWVITVSDVRPPWPIVFYTAPPQPELAVVLDHKQTRIEHPAALWITVPVLEPVPGYSREVSIELPSGEKPSEGPAELLAAAREKLDTGDYAHAAKILDRCINAFPSSADCHRLLGETYLKLGYQDEARAQFRAAGAQLE